LLIADFLSWKQNSEYSRIFVQDFSECISRKTWGMTYCSWCSDDVASVDHQIVKSISSLLRKFLCGRNQSLMKLPAAPVDSSPVPISTGAGQVFVRCQLYQHSWRLQWLGRSCSCKILLHSGTMAYWSSRIRR
jgi:hypothetical protein